MKPRRAPLVVPALDDGVRRPTREIDPYDDVQIEKVLKELSFVRFKLDQIVLPGVNQFIQKLHNYREFFGFQLEYSFPCLETVSKSLKTTIRIPEKDVDAMKIVFNHRRIVLLEMHPDQVEHWQKAQLTIHLMVNMAVNGRHTTRPLAKCHVPLAELTYPPYIIHRDFDFVGEEFEGTAEIRIDLGSRVKPLMEKLNNLRNDRSLEDTFVVAERQVGRRTRSRSTSRCRAHSSASLEAPRRRSTSIRRPHSTTSCSTSSETPILTHRISDNSSHQKPIQRPRIQSNSSIGSDSVFIRPSTEKPRVLEDVDPPRERITRSVTQSYGASTVGDTVEEFTRKSGKYYLEVTVHEAVGLPPVEDESGRITSPSSFISILGRDGDLRSPVFRNSRDPQWNFIARFAISTERRNLVIKVNHRGVLGDTALGYVTIPLPTGNVRKSVYEMTDVTRMAVKYTSQVPQLTISLERIRNIDDEMNYVDENLRRTSSPTRPGFFDHDQPPRYDSPPILESSEVIKDRMQRCMNDLENMMRGINK
uniref:C2 domain-containing protein n=1 Tax=Caenorhabditis tropicalis TaxID=1561998 RepID=A0A1I7ULH2_9PELO